MTEFFYAEYNHDGNDVESSIDSLLRFRDESERDEWVDFKNDSLSALFPEGVAQPVTEEEAVRGGRYNLARFTHDATRHEVPGWDAESIYPNLTNNREDK